MQYGIPQSLETAQGELVFNDLTGASSALSGVGIPFPSGLAPCGFLMSKITGMDGASIRNPVENRPHKGGGIVHPFKRMARVFTLEGTVVAPEPVTQQTMEDALRGYTDSIMDGVDGRYFFTPPGMPTRFMTVRLYEECSIVGDIPKKYTITLVAGDGNAYTYTQDETALSEGATITVPNDGNTQAWPVVKVYGPSSNFNLSDSRGFQLDWTGSLGDGHYIEIDFFKETMYNDGNGADRLGGLDLETADFWSVPKGGVDFTLTGATATILSNDAWV